MSSRGFGGRGLRVGDISHMAAVITLPHVGVSTITAFLIGLVNPAAIIEDIPTVIGFILVSFPLTLASAFITIAIIEKERKLSTLIAIIVISGIASNLLALVIPSPVHTNPSVSELLADSSSAVKGPMMFVVLAYKLVSVWWESYGPVMFVQSVAIGGFLGYRLGSREERA